MPTIEQLLSNKPVQKITDPTPLYNTSKWTAPIKKKILGKVYTINAKHSPDYFVNAILESNRKTKFTGVGVIAPPGHGKNVTVELLAHLLHTKRPEFSVVWAGGQEFKNQLEFYKNLPKRPTIIIFDDVTGTLNQVSEAKANECFEALTRIRHIFDPNGGKIPIIVFTLFHYSKNIPKDYRAQFGYKLFLCMNDEEKSNVDQVIDKKTRAYKTLINYAKIYAHQMEGKGFYLKASPSRQPDFHETDKPFRCGCVITLSWTNYMLTWKENCELCAKKFTVKSLTAEQVFDKVMAYDQGKAPQAIKMELANRGYEIALNPSLNNTWKFVKRVFSEYEIPYDDLITLIYKKMKKKKPTRKPHEKKKFADALFDELQDEAIETELPDETAIKEKEQTDTITEGMKIFDV